MNTDKHWVYEFYTRDGQILYVGCTVNLDQRFEGHARTKAWWFDVARIETTEYPDRATALRAEVARIRELDPPHNMMHTDRRPNSWTARRAAAEARHAQGEICRPWLGCKPCNRIHGPNVPKRIDWEALKAAARERAAA